MTVEALRRRVTDFGFTLMETEFALDAKVHKVKQLSARREALIWVRNPDAPLVIASPSKVGDYLSLLESQDYSYLMRDGGVIQVAFIYCDNHIEKHRLVYHPCPFHIDRHELEKFDGGLLDFIGENCMVDPDQNVLLRSPVRFDYAPESSADFHPASHITINDPCCRIPARAPLQFDTFIKFIFENFYLDAWNDSQVLRSLSFGRGQEAECLSVHDRERAYLNWAYP